MSERRYWPVIAAAMLLAACSGTSEQRLRPAPAPSVPPAQDAPLIRASVSGVGAQLDRGASDPVLSGDGNRVLFASQSTNVDVLGRTGVLFVKDLRTGAIFRPVGLAPSLSADGHRVASFDGPRLIVADLDTAAPTTVAEAPDQYGRWSGEASAVLSADGYRVAFLSDAALVPEDTNAQPDVFVKDLRTGELTRASTATGGAQSVVRPEDRKKAYDGEGGYPEVPVLSGLTMSADGGTVAFTSFAANLVPGDDNDAGDIFVKNLRTGALVRLRGPAVDSVARCASLSADGAAVAFSAQPAAEDPEFYLSGVFVARSSDGIAAAAAPGWKASPKTILRCPVLTGDGRRVLVHGSAEPPERSALPGAQRLWSIDVATGRVSTLVSPWRGGYISFNAAGDRLAWSTEAAELPEDTNRSSDVYVRRLP